MPDDVSRTSGQQLVPPSAQSFPAHPQMPAARTPLRVVIADDNPVVRAGLTVLLGGRDDIQVVAEAVDGQQALHAAERHRPDVILLDVRMPGVDGISALPHLVRAAPVMMLTYSRESEVVREALRLGAGGYLVHGEFTADQLIAAVRDVKEGRAHFTATAANALLAQLRGGDAEAPGEHPLPDGLGAAYHGAPRGGDQGAQLPGVPRQHMPSVLTSTNSGESASHLQSNVAQSLPRQVTARDIRPPDPQPACVQAEFGLSSREVEVMDLIASGMSNQQIAAACFISEKTVKNHINRIFAKLQAVSRSEAIAVWLGTSHTGTGSGRG
ncbi:response regulator [Streptomyces sp. NPDC059828]|uniref:response regulator n=1 Tax=Streptomyces sp. NPDC059828 TaxID=3346965 RepID=UPI0036611C32